MKAVRFVVRGRRAGPLRAEAELPHARPALRQADAAGGRRGRGARPRAGCGPAGGWASTSTASEHEIGPDDVQMVLQPLEGYQVERAGTHAVALNLELDDELRREGLAREVVHAVQAARKAAGLEVEDRIALTLGGDAALLDAARAHEDYVSRRDARARRLEYDGRRPASAPRSRVGPVHRRRSPLGWRRHEAAARSSTSVRSSLQLIGARRGADGLRAAHGIRARLERGGLLSHGRARSRSSAGSWPASSTAAPTTASSAGWWAGSCSAASSCWGTGSPTPTPRPTCPIHRSGSCSSPRSPAASSARWARLAQAPGAAAREPPRCSKR